MRACALPALLVPALCARPASAAVRKEILHRDIETPGSANGPASVMRQQSMGTVGPGVLSSADTLDSTPLTSSGWSTSSNTPVPSTSTPLVGDGTPSKTTVSCEGDVAACPAAPTLSDTVPPKPPSSSTNCIPIDQMPHTVISITYTTTTTFYGNPTDYTPPYPTITTLPSCPPPPSENPPPAVPMPTLFPSISTITFITTEKNPSVVFSPGAIPNYSSSKKPPITKPGQHKTAKPTNPGNEAPRPRPTYTVTAGPGSVIIGGTTFDGINPGQTRTVVAGGGTFTILPTAVVGEGVTVARPVPAEPTADFVPSPTSASVGGLPIWVSGSILEIDGRTMTIPPGGVTTNINGQPVSLGPGIIVVDGSETFTWPGQPALATDVLVVGGQMLTASGSAFFILNSTTLTYGPRIEETFTTVDDDTITVGPRGIIVDGSTLGGSTAGPSDVTYQVVGGVTVTQLGHSLKVIDGHTYTMGHGTEPITISAGGGLVTIVPPHGIVYNSLTFGQGSDAGVITATFEPNGTATDDFPTETGSDTGEDDEDDMAAGRGPDILLAGLCAALVLWAFNTA